MEIPRMGDMNNSGKEELIRQFLNSQQNSISELSAERLNLFLQHGDTDPMGESMEGTSLPNNLPPLSSVDSLAKREPLSRKERWKEYLRISLPHIGLVALSLIYTVLGAVMFYCLEQPEELRQRNETLFNLKIIRENITNTLWETSQQGNETQWKIDADRILIELLQEVHTPYIKDYITPTDMYSDDPKDHKLRWTFAASIFFSWTAITTIGYGHIVPRTTGGRVTCLIYALIGIPLILVTIADMGRFLSTGIIWVHQVWRRFPSWCCYNLKRCCRFLFCFWKRKGKGANDSRASRRPHLLRSNEPKRYRRKDPDSPDKSGTFEEISEIQTRSQHSPEKTLDTAEAAGLAELEEEEMRRTENEKRVSVTFVLIILVGYTAAGAGMLRLWENWSFFDAFYYCFVTVTTIGFGDIVPTQESFFFATLAYIVLGLIITTMCIDLVGSEYIRDIHFYGRNLGRLTQQALMTFGGKVIHLGEVFNYVAFLQRNYGLTADEIDKLANLPDNYLLECMMSGKQPNPNWLLSRPYIPFDIYYFKWIEQPRTHSYASEKVFASMESIDVTSRCSTARTPREYYQHILMQYCREGDTKL